MHGRQCARAVCKIGLKHSGVRFKSGQWLRRTKDVEQSSSVERTGRGGGDHPTADIGDHHTLAPLDRECREGSLEDSLNALVRARLGIASGVGQSVLET